MRADLARECGLPPSAILSSSLARSTREEALRIQSLLSSRGIRKVMLVAAGPGMFRAVRTFERLGFVVVPRPSSGALELGGGAEDRPNLLRQVAIEFVARVGESAVPGGQLGPQQGVIGFNVGGLEAGFATPEAAWLLLVGTGAVGVGLARWWKRRRAAV